MTVNLLAGVVENKKVYVEHVTLACKAKLGFGAHCNLCSLGRAECDDAVHHPLGVTLRQLMLSRAAA